MADDLVFALVRDALQLEESYPLTDDVKLQDIPGLDSLGQVRLVMGIESCIDDRLSIDAVLAIESVGDIREILTAKGKNSAEA